MSNVIVKFFEKENEIPSDVVTYVGLVDFTNGIRDSLNTSFKKQIRSNIDVIESCAREGCPAPDFIINPSDIMIKFTVSAE